MSLSQFTCSDSQWLAFIVVPPVLKDNKGRCGANRATESNVATLQQAHRMKAQPWQGGFTGHHKHKLTMSKTMDGHRGKNGRSINESGIILGPNFPPKNWAVYPIPEHWSCEKLFSIHKVYLMFPQGCGDWIVSAIYCTNHRRESYETITPHLIYNSTFYSLLTIVN